MLLSLLWTSADNSWAPPSHSLADNCQTTSLFPRIGLSCGTSLEFSSREGGILFYTIVPPHSLGSQYDVCSLSVAIPVTGGVYPSSRFILRSYGLCEARVWALTLSKTSMNS